MGKKILYSFANCEFLLQERRIMLPNQRRRGKKTFWWPPSSEILAGKFLLKIKMLIERGKREKIASRSPDTRVHIFSTFLAFIVVWTIPPLKKKNEESKYVYLDFCGKKNQQAKQGQEAAAAAVAYTDFLFTQ